MKKHINWFQDINNLSTTDNQITSSFTVFKDIYTPKTTSIDTSTPAKDTSEQSLKNSLLSELQQFKQQQLYEEALACIQSLFEINAVDENVIYELAHIYLLTNDHERAFKWLQQLKIKAPQDNRIHLLEAQFFLEINKKDEALSAINQLLNSPEPLSQETQYITLDNIINKLKKIFKTDKLLRRCPALNNYWKQRRQSLKNQKISTNTAINNINLNNTEGDTMPQINTSLQIALTRIWDLHHATKEDTATILATPATELSNAIMQQVLSYSKKLWLFNYMADIFRQEKNLSTAIYLLRQALLLDDENDLILKNLGYIFYQQKDYHNALNTLNDIKIKDFSVNDFINKCREQIN